MTNYDWIGDAFRLVWSIFETPSPFFGLTFGQIYLGAAIVGVSILIIRTLIHGD